MQPSKLPIFLLRVSLGWLFLYSGLSHVLDPKWTSKGYLLTAKTFTGFYLWMTDPSILPTVDFMSKWGLTLLGATLILGIFVRLAGWLGSLLMALFYLPVLTFPTVAHGFLVDEHIIYICALLVLGATHAGRIWGLETWCSNLPICKKYPALRSLIG